MVRSSQRTLYMVDLDLHRQLNVPYRPILNTTLNEKFNVLQSDALPEGKYPSLIGFVIGIGGAPVVEGYNAYAFNEHSPIDGALFEHIPFIIREYENDLTAQERTKYRLRTVETIANKQYACYYMRTINSIELKNHFYSIKTIKTGDTVSSPSLSIFDTNISTILNPVPRNRTISYDTAEGGQYVAKLARIEFLLTEEDQDEIKKVLEIKEKSTSVITELGVCTGIDVTSNGNKETLATQIAYHIPVNFALTIEFANRGNLGKVIELGGMEAYLY